MSLLLGNPEETHARATLVHTLRSCKVAQAMGAEDEPQRSWWRHICVTNFATCFSVPLRPPVATVSEDAGGARFLPDGADAYGSSNRTGQSCKSPYRGSIPRAASALAEIRLADFIGRAGPKRRGSRPLVCRSTARK
jgi:hypothetical protein